MSENRLFLSTSENPRILWSKVEGAKSYHFKMSKKLDSKILWELEVNNPELIQHPEDSGNDFCFIDYPGPPSLYPLLKPGETYILTGETNNGKYILDMKSEIKLLESSALRAIEEFRVELESTVNQELVEMFYDAIEETLVSLKGSSRSAPRWYPKLYCLSVEFT